MTKDQFGINISAIAIIAFVLTGLNIVGSGLITVILITAFAIIVEKNSWLNKQVLQALYLSIGYQIAVMVISWTFSPFYEFMSYSYVLNIIDTILNAVLGIGLILISILAITRVMHERDAHLPIIGNLADYTLGKPRPPKPVYQPPVYQQPYQQPGAPGYPQQYPQQGAPVYQQPYPQQGAPVYQQPPAPVYQQPVAPVAPVSEQPEAKPAKAAKAPEVAAAPMQTDPAGWTCSCGRQNAGKFCMGCGKPRP